MRRTSAEPPVRVLSMATVACLILALVGSLAADRPASARAGESATSEPIDLIAMLPGVLDIEEIGLEGFTPSQVRDYTSAEDYVEDMFLDVDVQQLTEDMESAGFVRYFHTYWVDPTTFDEPSLGDGFKAQTVIAFSIDQFATADGVAEGFRFITDGDVEIPDADVSFGDEAEAREVDFIDDPSRLRYQGAGITVRLGSLVIEARMQTRDRSPEQGDELDLTSDLMTTFVERLDALDHFPTATTALKTVRFQNAAIVTALSGYPLLDSAPHWDYYWDTPAERDQEIARDVAQGAVSRYEIRQWLNTRELDGEEFGYILGSWVQTYEGIDEAEAGFAARVPFWESDNWDVTVIDDAPELGDESVAIQAVDPDGTNFHSLMIWRDGVDVHELYLRLPTRFADPDALFALVDAQTACVADGDCWEAQEVPDAVLEDAGPLRASPASTTATPTPSDDGATPTAPAGDAFTYEGEEFDFSLSWDEDVWSRDEDYEPQLGAEGLRLDRVDGGTLFIEAINDRSGRSVARCLEDTVNLVLVGDGVDNVEPALNSDGDEIAGETDDYAFAAYTVTFEGEPEFNYVGCATLEVGETAIAFVYISADVEDIDAQIEDIEKFIEEYEAG